MDLKMSKHPIAIEDLLKQCSEAGLRRTAALEACLRVLATADQPLTLQQIAASAEFGVSCDPATIYRLVSRLEERRIVRRIGFHSRAAHYCLRESSHQDYLICRDCGSVEVLDIACPVEHLEKQIAEESGFSDLEHELEFFGRCGTCQK
jgi:Fe2+ or Zn2+ uptake regulation protein